MNKVFSLFRMLSLVPVLAACVIQVNAQSLESIKSQEELNKVITSLDTALFDAYNHCDLEKFAGNKSLD